MKIKSILGSLLLLAGMAFGQSQFSGGGSGNGGGGGGTGLPRLNLDGRLLTTVPRPRK